MPRQLNFEITSEFDGVKLVAYLRGHLKISARLLTKLKKDPVGLLKNGEHIRTVDRIYAGDTITVNLPDETSDIPPSVTDGLKIVYEDEDILVVNKPSGIAMHPTHNHQGDTLANMITAYFIKNNKNIVFRTVGRLDKCTSGLVVVALNPHVANILSEGIEKEYIAVADGVFYGEGTINKPIIRPDPMKTCRWVGEDGEYAVTHWRCILTDGNRSLLRIHLETGRTHQIRVHFASLGAPLAGDDMYGSDHKDIARAALHCTSLRFIHPVTKVPLVFEAPLPEDMQFLYDTIKKNRQTHKFDGSAL